MKILLITNSNEIFCYLRESSSSYNFHKQLHSQIQKEKSQIKWIKKILNVSIVVDNVPERRAEKLISGMMCNSFLQLFFLFFLWNQLNET